MCALFISRRDAEAQRFCPFYPYSSCFEASLSQRLGWGSGASGYALCVLCDLMWFISRKGAKLAKAVGLLCLFCVFLSAALAQRLCGLIHASPFAFFCFFCGECMCVFLAEAQRLCSSYACALCFEASLSRRLWVLISGFALCVLM